MYQVGIVRKLFVKRRKKKERYNGSSDEESRDLRRNVAKQQTAAAIFPGVTRMCATV